MDPKFDAALLTGGGGGGAPGGWTVSTKMSLKYKPNYPVSVTR
jgi:hypothetical protein